MSLGQTDFLIPYWAKNEFPYHIRIDQDTRYFYGSLQELKDNIVLIHKKLKNAETKDSHIVIGNGVTQLLNALVHCNSSPLVYAEPPHYHRFFKFAELSNKHWIKHEDGLKIVTLPTNPTGKKDLQVEKNAIYDLNYNWPQYGRVDNYNFDIMVFGLSKAIGFSSARIGWALIKNEELAEKVLKYIEYSTGGVSIYSQKLAARLLEKQYMADGNVFDYGKKILDSRWRDLWYNCDVPFEITNSEGLFLWCKGTCPSDIKGISGEVFGSTDEYFRLSIGIPEKDWEIFKERYGKK